MNLRRDRIPEILERIDLNALVSECAGPATRSAGTTATYHCPHPTHLDAHPSFMVKDNRWHCWSQCAASGNAIDFLIFVGVVRTTAEAIEALAQRAGMGR